jgi:Na+-transporting NADH:ubiquinone oxidoreductase subunit C
MSDKLKSLVFAAIMCLVCSLLLTTASIGLQGFQQANIILDKHTNLLKSVGLIDAGRRYSAAEIDQLYTSSIKAIWINPDGTKIDEKDRGDQDLPLYIYMQGNDIAAYIIPIQTRGLWGKIFGYLAIENDGVTVSGFTVYKHSETPGLGGEIEKRWFEKNWVGKKIVDQSGEFVSVGIAKGSIEDKIPLEEQINYVDGISGATLTGHYLSAGIREILEKYEPVSVRFRKSEHE